MRTLQSSALHDPFQMEYGAFRCLECGTMFPSELSIESHIQKKHTAKCLYTCAQCRKTFKDSWHLKKHENCHETPRAICANCRQTFKDNVMLNKHQTLGLCVEVSRRDAGLAGWGDLVEWFEVKEGLSGGGSMLLLCRICGQSATNLDFYHHVERHSSEMYHIGPSDPSPLYLRERLCLCPKASLASQLGVTAFLA